MVVLSCSNHITFTCAQSTIETLKKNWEIYSGLIIKTPERRHFEQVNVSRETIQSICNTSQFTNFYVIK